MTRGRFTQTATIAAAKRSKGLSSQGGLSIPAALPDMPEELSEEARSEWERIASTLVDENRLAKQDRWLLATYCETWALWQRSCDKMRLTIDRYKHNLWGIDANNKPMVLVDCIVFTKLSKQLLEQCLQFGMTARARHLDHASGGGRPKNPIEQHLLRGDPSRLMTAKNRRAAEEALKEQRKASEVADRAAPHGLPGSANKEWARMVEQLTSHGMYCPLDRAALAVGCVAWSIFRAAEKQMREQPLSLPSGDSGRSVKHPLLTVLDESWSLINSVAKEFAMGPVWRRRWRADVVAGDLPSHLKIFMGSRSTG